jgi:type I site-specific restriction-modification system R (restriction) subunit
LGLAPAAIHSATAVWRRSCGRSGARPAARTAGSQTLTRKFEELIGLARTIREAAHRGAASGLTEEEIAFYDALADNKSARDVMQDDTLKLIARELADRIKAKASLD